MATVPLIHKLRSSQENVEYDDYDNSSLCAQASDVEDEDDDNGSLDAQALSSAGDCVSKLSDQIQEVGDGDRVQAWCADDAQCIGKLKAIRRWWDLLREYDPMFG